MSDAIVLVVGVFAAGVMSGWAIETWVARIEMAIRETSATERALLEHIRDAIDIAAADDEAMK